MSSGREDLQHQDGGGADHHCRQLCHQVGSILCMISYYVIRKEIFIYIYFETKLSLSALKMFKLLCLLFMLQIFYVSIVMLSGRDYFMYQKLSASKYFISQK